MNTQYAQSAIVNTAHIIGLNAHDVINMRGSRNYHLITAKLTSILGKTLTWKWLKGARQMNHKYIVFWRNNGRLGAVDLTEDNRTKAHKLMELSLLMRDLVGNEHYEVWSVNKGAIVDIEA